MLVFEILAGVALVYSITYFFANRLLYHPERYPKGHWEMQAEFGAQDVFVPTPDGLGLHAWWITTPGSRMVTLYLHGNNGNVSTRPGHLREIIGGETSVLALDYRGYGRSRGWPTERGLYMDADAGYDYLIRQGFQPSQIVVQGESLGSAVAVDLASRRPCAALVLECPLTSAAAMAAKTVPIFGPLFVRGYHSIRKIANVHAPLLIIHGDDDPVVPYAMGRALFDAANEPKFFWTVEGARHKTVVKVAGKRYRARLHAFYESLQLQTRV